MPAGIADAAPGAAQLQRRIRSASHPLTTAHTVAGATAAAAVADDAAAAELGADAAAPGLTYGRRRRPRLRLRRRLRRRFRVGRFDATATEVARRMQRVTVCDVLTLEDAPSIRAQSMTAAHFRL